MRRIWDKSKFPTGPFTLNKDCWQAQNLVNWYPLGGISAPGYVADLVSGKNLTGSISPSPIIMPDGSPAGSYNGTTAKLGSGAAPSIYAAPISVSAWISPTATSGNQVILCFGAFSDVSANRFQFDFNINAIRWIAVGLTNGVASTAASLVANKLQHILGVEASSTSRTAYLNGKGGTTDTTSVVPAGTPNHFTVGALAASSTSSLFFSGLIGEICVWSKAMSAFEASYLADPGNRFELYYPLRSKKWFTSGLVPGATNDVWLYNTAIPSGNDVWLRTTRPAASSTVNYTLTASAGSYSYTGQSATLKSSRTLSAANGSYSYTGQPATLVYKRQITANQGTYNLTGQAATFSLAKKLTAASGSYSIAGQVATLKYARQITAASGSYTYSGQASTLTYKRQITAASGSYSYSGQAATFNYARQITAANGAYSYTGQAATFTYTPGGGGAVSYTLTAAVGSYAYTGQGATFVYSRKLVAAAGAYSYSGQSATLVKGRNLNATVGSYSYSGQSATFSFSRKLPASAGSYSYSGQAASFTFSRNLSALSGSYAYTGNIATFVYSRSITANAGSYVYTGQAAILTFTGTSHYTLGCQPGSYSITGYPASLTYTNNTLSTSSPAPDFGGGGGAFYRGGKSYELRRKDRTEKPKYDIITVEQQDEEQEEEFIIAFVLSQIIRTGHLNDG